MWVNQQWWLVTLLVGGLVAVVLIFRGMDGKATPAANGMVVGGFATLVGAFILSLGLILSEERQNVELLNAVLHDKYGVTVLSSPEPMSDVAGRAGYSQPSVIVNTPQGNRTCVIGIGEKPADTLVLCENNVELPQLDTWTGA